MKIRYYGESCFYIKSGGSKLVTNPFDRNTSIRLNQLEPDVVVLSHDAKVKKNDFYLINCAGEFEVKDLFVYGYVSNASDVDTKGADVYMFDIKGVNIGMIDKSARKVRSWVINQMGIVNVLLVSLSDESNMKLSKLSDLVNKIEPEVVIPMDFTKKKLDEFKKVLGVKDVEEDKSFKAKASSFSEEEVSTRIVVLEK